MDLQELIEVLHENTDSLRPHERAEVRGILNNIEGSTPDADQLEKLQDYADRFL